MCEHIDYENFVQFAYPSLKRIATELKQRHPDIPLLGFARDAPYGIEWLQMAGYDVMTVDTVSDRRACRDTLKFEAGVRGVQPGSLQARLSFTWPSLVAHRVPVTR